MRSEASGTDEGSIEMRNIAIKVSLVFLLAGLLWGCDESSLKLNYKMTREVLPNGLKVLLVEDRSIPLVNFSTMVRVGGVWEKEGKTGLAHLFEHMMFKGTPKYPGRGFMNAIESRGGTVNAYTKQDMTVFYETIASEHLDLILDIESDRLQNLIINDEQLATEKKVVLEERRMRLGNDFSAQQLTTLMELMFADHPYGRPVIGSEEDITNLKLEECVSFFKTYYQPGNIILVISGDFDSDELLKKIKKIYGVIPGKSLAPLAVSQPQKMQAEIRKTIIRPVESESVLLGYQVPAHDHLDMLPLVLYKMALFDMKSSKVQEYLVREKQLAVAVGSDLEGQLFPSPFFVRMVLRKGVPGEVAIEAFDEIIEKTKVELFSERELKRVKNWVESYLLVAGRTGMGLAYLLGLGEFYDGDYRISLKDVDDFKRVTAGDLQRIARTYFIKENRAIVYMKPTGSAQ